MKKHSNGLWLLLLDNCGGLDPNFSYPNVRIEHFSPNTTIIYQPLDQSLISHTKIRDRSIRLHHICEIAEKKQTNNHNFKQNSGGAGMGCAKGNYPMSLMQSIYSMNLGLQHEKVLCSSAV